MLRSNADAKRKMVDDGNSPLVYNTYVRDDYGKFCLRGRGNEVDEIEATAHLEEEQIFSRRFQRPKVCLRYNSPDWADLPGDKSAIDREYKGKFYRGGVRVMALDERAVAETELHEDTPVMLVDGKPVPPSAIQLVDGVFIDEEGRPAATVKHQTWY